MLVRFFFLSIFLCSYQFLLSQSQLSGKVTNKEDNKPLSGVSIYLSNTSIGINTNEQGEFTFRKFPSGKFQLVVSHVGYETYTKLINSKNLPQELTIELKPISTQLPDIVLEPWETYGWEKWGTLFTEMFIGTSIYSRDCSIKNTEAIKFRLNKKNNSLTAVAYVPLIIVNNSLGYEIEYKMEDFEYNFSTKVVIYNGYPLFKDMSQSHPSKASRWQEKRRNVYYGSVLHFMRSLFMNKLEEEGYEMRSLTMIRNLQKDRARLLFKNGADKIQSKTDSSYVLQNGIVKLITEATDSTEVYKRYLKQPDWIVSNELIRSDSICYAVDSSTLSFFSSDSLEVSFLHKDVPIEYKRTNQQHRFEKIPVSQFVFIHQKPIYVMHNGYYYGPYDMKITGFWAWWETMATLLPYDYLPPKKE